VEVSARSVRTRLLSRDEVCGRGDGHHRKHQRLTRLRLAADTKGCFSLRASIVSNVASASSRGRS
jgi:hypothetical protein